MSRFDEKTNEILFKPGLADEKRRICAAVILMGLIMMVSELLEQQQTRPTGRWAFFFGPIWDLFGWYGLAAYWFGISAIFAAFYFFFLRNKS